jgi:hypothetical protein
MPSFLVLRMFSPWAPHEALDSRRRSVQSSAEVVSPGDNLRQKPKSLSQVSVVIGFDGLGRKSDQLR